MLTGGSAFDKIVLQKKGFLQPGKYYWFTLREARLRRIVNPRLHTADGHRPFGMRYLLLGNELETLRGNSHISDLEEPGRERRIVVVWEYRRAGYEA